MGHGKPELTDTFGRRLRFSKRGVRRVLLDPVFLSSKTGDFAYAVISCPEVGAYLGREDATFWMSTLYGAEIAVKMEELDPLIDLFLTYCQGMSKLPGSEESQETSCDTT